MVYIVFFRSIVHVRTYTEPVSVPDILKLHPAGVATGTDYDTKVEYKIRGIIELGLAPLRDKITSKIIHQHNHTSRCRLVAILGMPG